MCGIEHLTWEVCVLFIIRKIGTTGRSYYRNLLGASTPFLHVAPATVICLVLVPPFFDFVLEPATQVV
jgi:hypothetical protein